MCAQSTGSYCTRGMTQRVLDAIGEVGTPRQITVAALVNAIEQGGYLDALWESEKIWRLRMAWAEELHDTLGNGASRGIIKLLGKYKHVYFAYNFRTLCNNYCNNITVITPCTMQLLSCVSS